MGPGRIEGTSPRRRRMVEGKEGGYHSPAILSWWVRASIHEPNCLVDLAEIFIVTVDGTARIGRADATGFDEG